MYTRIVYYRFRRVYHVDVRGTTLMRFFVFCQLLKEINSCTILWKCHCINVIFCCYDVCWLLLLFLQGSSWNYNIKSIEPETWPFQLYNIKKTLLQKYHITLLEVHFSKVNLLIYAIRSEWYESSVTRSFPCFSSHIQCLLQN